MPDITQPLIDKCLPVLENEIGSRTPYSRERVVEVGEGDLGVTIEVFEDIINARLAVEINDFESIVEKVHVRLGDGDSTVRLTIIFRTTPAPRLS